MLTKWGKAIYKYRRNRKTNGKISKQ